MIIWNLRILMTKAKKQDCDLFTSQKIAGASITLCLANDEILAYARFNIPAMNQQNATQAMVYFKNFQAWNSTQDNHDSIFEVPTGCELEMNSTYSGGSGEKRSFENSFEHSFVKPIRSFLKL